MTVQTEECRNYLAQKERFKLEKEKRLIDLQRITRGKGRQNKYYLKGYKKAKKKKALLAFYFRNQTCGVHRTQVKADI